MIIADFAVEFNCPYRVHDKITGREVLMRDAWHTSGSVWGGVLLLGVAVLTVAICRGDALFVNYFALKQDRARLEEKIEALEQKNTALKQQEKLLQSSPEYAKKVLREKYNYREENEEIIFVPH